MKNIRAISFSLVYSMVVMTVISLILAMGVNQELQNEGQKVEIGKGQSVNQFGNTSIGGGNIGFGNGYEISMPSGGTLSMAPPTWGASSSDIWNPSADGGTMIAPGVQDNVGDVVIPGGATTTTPGLPSEGDDNIPSVPDDFGDTVIPGGVITPGLPSEGDGYIPSAPDNFGGTVIPGGVITPGFPSEGDGYTPGVSGGMSSGMGGATATTPGYEINTLTPSIGGNSSDIMIFTPATPQYTVSSGAESIWQNASLLTGAMTFGSVSVTTVSVRALNAHDNTNALKGTYLSSMLNTNYSFEYEPYVRKRSLKRGSSEKTQNSIDT